MLTPQFTVLNNSPFSLSRKEPADRPEPVPPDFDVDCGDGDSMANILLVDDTPENLIALEAVLGELGQNLVKARSGDEALRLLLKQDFAVILLDVNMPGLTGFETAELIRQRKSTEHTPIIFVSAISTSDTHLFKGYSLGAVDYIFTPVDPEVLRSKVTVFVDLLKKTEEVRRQAERLRKLEEQEHLRRLSDASRRLALQTQQNRFFTLSVDLLAIAGFDGRFRELNPAWEKVLGYSREELSISPFWAWMDAADRDRVTTLLRKTIETQTTAHFESRCQCKNGSYRCFAWTIAPYGAEELLYLFGRDMTERYRAEQEIRKLNQVLESRAGQLQSTNADLQAEIAYRKQAEEALHESNSALEAFSFSVSHDLRAPIRAMQGFAKVLLEDYSQVLDEMGRECATRIVHAAERMDSLVQDLLIYSRLGHTTLELSPISLQETLLDAIGQIEHDLKQRQAAIELVEPLPWVSAHAVTLTQVLVNLISNGTKFVAPHVSPRVKVWADQNEHFATLWLQDNGIGIRTEDRTRIFRVFERLHGTDEYPGTGLGLAIVRKGIERMGGQVGVESEVGKGSRFWIRLKLSTPIRAC